MSNVPGRVITGAGPGQPGSKVALPPVLRCSFRRVRRSPRQGHLARRGSSSCRCMESEDPVVADRQFRPNRECTAIAVRSTRQCRMASTRTEETEGHRAALADECAAGRSVRDHRQFLGVGARVRASLLLGIAAVGRAAAGYLHTGRAQLRRDPRASPMRAFSRQPNSEWPARQVALWAAHPLPVTADNKPEDPAGGG
jgi:hypothetical protein